MYINIGVNMKNIANIIVLSTLILGCVANNISNYTLPINDFAISNDMQVNNLLATSVRIVVDVKGNTFSDTGAGTIIGEDKDYLYIITVDHLFPESSSNIKNIFVYASTDNYCSVGINATLVCRSFSNNSVDSFDLALIKIPKINSQFSAKSIISPMPPICTPVYRVGEPYNENGVITYGIISKYKIYDNGLIIILSDARTALGNSGGGLFTTKGEFIGVTTRSWSDGFGMAISSYSVKKWLNKMGYNLL